MFFPPQSGVASKEDSVEGITLPVASRLPLHGGTHEASSRQTHKTGKEGTKEEDPWDTKVFKGPLYIPWNLEYHVHSQGQTHAQKRSSKTTGFYLRLIFGVCTRRRGKPRQMCIGLA